MTITKEFGKAVKRRRTELNMTQSELAERAGIARETVAVIENGTKKQAVKNTTAEAIAKALRSRVAVLLEDSSK